MQNTEEKAIEKVSTFILMTELLDIDNWEKQKALIRFMIQQQIDSSYMIDRHYYKDYVNFWNLTLTILNDL